MILFLNCSFILANKVPFEQGFDTDVTNVYLQQTQGIDLLIHLNELLHNSMAQYMACVSSREF